MPMIDTDGCLLNVSDEGRQSGPTLMLSNSLGSTMQMWEPQMKALTQLFRVIRYDRRGHGKSAVAPGPYSMERFGRDALAILDDLNIEKAHWCGLSMGGMVGQWLGANAGNRVNKLILSNTSSYFPDKAMWNGRLQMVREKGLAGMGDANMERWFTKGFRERAPQDMKKMHDMFVATKLDGYIGCGEAVRDMDHRPLLPKIAAPTLVIAGKHDPATPLEGNEYIQKNITGAKLAVLDAAHIANIEQPQAYTDTVLGFLLN